MAYDIQEQEQLDALKDWWKTYGNRVLILIALGLFAFTGFMGWQWCQRKQITEAGPVYEALIKAASEKNLEKVTAASNTLREKYERTPHAQYGVMLAAKLLFGAGDSKTAQAQLQWVSTHGLDEVFRAGARLRLAGILLDEKSYDAALAQLKDNPPDVYIGLFADRRGDIYVAQNKLNEARQAYDLALAKTGEKDPAYQLVMLKRDALGTAAASTTASVSAATTSATVNTGAGSGATQPGAAKK